MLLYPVTKMVMSSTTIFYIKIHNIKNDQWYIKEERMTRKKVFWNDLAFAMVNSFIRSQFFLYVAIIWLFMLQGTTEEAAAVAKLSG